MFSQIDILKELAHVVIEVTSLKIYIWQVGHPRKSIAQFISKSEGLRTRRTKGIVHSESQQNQYLRRTVFNSTLKARKKLKVPAQGS